MLQITDTIYLLHGRNKGRFPFCHCLYIKDDINVLIDSAAGDEQLKPVLGRVDVLLNSHFHPDHVRGNGLFPKAHIRCHEADVAGLISYEGMLRYTGYDRFTPQEIAKFMPVIDHRPSRVDSTFTDGEILDFGKTKLRVIHLPGHTPGHCCFLEENTGLLFGADIDITRFGPWYGHELSDLEQFESSMDHLFAIEPALFVSGHDDGFIKDNIMGRLRNYAQIFHERDERILAALRKPHTHEELACSKIIYPRHPEPSILYYYFEWQMLKKHLAKLVKQKQVTLSDGRYAV